ncbi:hypothetical protein ACEQ8H_000909 [Pleosporales sp. CAS-2024a]
MKREHTHINPEDKTFTDAQQPKRLKKDPSYEDIGSKEAVPHPRTNPRNLSRESTKAIESWIQLCASSAESDMPQTPSSTSSQGPLRRALKQLQRQRSQSPVKNINAVQYRETNMADANVFVDHYHDPPPEVDARLKRIFAEAVPSAEQLKLLNTLSEQYCTDCRVLAKKCAGENEWRSNLFLNLLQLTKPDSEVFMLSASEKLPILPNTPNFSAPSTNASDVFSENPNNVLTSKPDISLGLAHNSFTPVQRRVLRLLQDGGHVLSDPHQAQVGLRFPFLVVEAKGAAASGNMIGAQNRAAVDGACAMNILGDLQNVVTRITTTVQHQSCSGMGDNEDENNLVPAIMFSVTTEGPLHELWVHYQLGDTYQMTCHRAWRPTHLEDARDFVGCLARIVNWGKQGFRDDLLSLLARPSPTGGRRRTRATSKDAPVALATGFEEKRQIRQRLDDFKIAFHNIFSRIEATWKLDEISGRTESGNKENVAVSAISRTLEALEDPKEEETQKKPLPEVRKKTPFP